MRGLTPTLIIIATALTAGAGEPRPSPRRLFGGAQVGVAWSAAAANRIAAAGNGAAFRGEAGYLASRTLVFPYLSAGATWARGRAPTWEAEGYKEEPRYEGLSCHQLLVGGLYRRLIIGDRLGAYAGPAFLYSWLRREVLTWDGIPMVKRPGAGPGWAVLGGVTLPLAAGAPHAVGAQLFYGRAYAKWYGMPPAADARFVFKQFQISFTLRYYF